MLGSATWTIVTSTSSMNVPPRIATSAQPDSGSVLPPRTGATLRRQETRGDGHPAPARLDRAAAGEPERSRSQARARAARRAVRAARPRRRSGTRRGAHAPDRVLRGDPGGDLGEAGVVRRRRRHAAAAASAATIPNASGKIDGTTETSQSGSRWTRCRCSSGPGEERPRRRERLELGRGSRRSRRRPRARRGPRAPRAARGRPCSRSACRSRGRSARSSAKKRGEPRGVALVGEALLARCPGSAGRGAPPRGGRRAPAGAAPDGTRRRRRRAGPTCTRSTWPTTSSSTSRMCSEPT